jgi:hypothetical protein
MTQREGTDSAGRDRLWIVLLLLAGTLPRAWWAWRHGLTPQGGEAQNIATALVLGRGYADPYFTGSGPTAHLLPTMPLLVAGVYRLFGIRTAVAETVLEGLALVELFGGFWLLFRLFARLGVARLPRIGALAALCLLPVYWGQESLDFRYWEGALALCLALGSLHLLLTLHRQAAPPTRPQEAVTAALAAATLFVSPPLGIGVGLGAGLLILQRPAWPHRWRPIALAAGFTLLLVGPWALRNAHTLGRPILLRDNAPLEMSLANNPLALTLPADDAFNRRMKAIHPLQGGAGTARVGQVGELRYMDELNASLHAWIAAHPLPFARLCLLHLREMLWPSPWQFRLGSGLLAGPRAALVGIVSLLGLLGLVRGLRQGPEGWRYPAIVVAVAVLTYLPFQPVPRYLWLLWGLFMFSAASMAGRLSATDRMEVSGS